MVETTQAAAATNVGRARSASERIEFANTLRGLAAFVVLIAHVGVTYWYHPAIVEWLTGVPYTKTAAPKFFTALNLTYDAIGGYGVALFFVISGFVIPFSLERYSVKGFLVGRLFRIWPTYWVGFACTLLSIVPGVYFMGGRVAYSARDAVLHFFPPLRALADTTFIDAIVWTLEIELLFYVVCAMAAPLMRRGSAALLLVAPAILAVWAGVDFVASHGDPWLASRLRFFDNGAPYIVFMFCGVALNLLQRGKIALTTAAVAILGYYGLFAAANIWGAAQAKAELPVYAAALATFIVSMIAQDWFRPHWIFRFLSDISYPLYVVHGVVGFMLLTAMTRAGWDADLATATTVAVAVLLAYAIHRFVEAPSHRRGQELARRLSADLRAARAT